MVSITLSVPESVKQKMDHFSEINWSGFVRKAVEEKTQELSWKENMLKKLKQDAEFEQWCVEMGRKVNEGVARRLKAEGLI
ncbi:MAG TPA: hypothetical protein VJH88_01800 [Candidatus Nanoarchaeia archaeon]|nr:hypothetical protein [Candidatus Nanoarchaeia archaeon]